MRSTFVEDCLTIPMLVIIIASSKYGVILTTLDGPTLGLVTRTLALKFVLILEHLKEWLTAGGPRHGCATKSHLIQVIMGRDSGPTEQTLGCKQKKQLNQLILYPLFVLPPDTSL
jgi:hypothetical protein